MQTPMALWASQSAPKTIERDPDVVCRVRREAAHEQHRHLMRGEKHAGAAPLESLQVLAALDPSQLSIADEVGTQELERAIEQHANESAVELLEEARRRIRGGLVRAALPHGCGLCVSRAGT